MAKTRKQKWFIRIRGSYLPSSWQGWLTYIPYVAYLVGVLVLVLRSYNGFWMIMLILVPNWIAALAIMQWIAARKS